MNNTQETNRKSLKGFTLLEMMIVLAIIATLVAVLIPISTGYMTRSRMNTANSNAKVIFNSLQTLMQEQRFTERGSGSYSIFYDNTRTGQVYLEAEFGHIVTCNTYAAAPGVDLRGGGGSPQKQIKTTDPNPEVDFTDTRIAATPVAMLGRDMADSNAASFGARLSRLYSGYNEVCFRAIFQNYSVRGVVCATSLDSEYVGAYPVRGTARGEVPGSGQTGLELSQYDVSVLATYCDAAWS